MALDKNGCILVLGEQPYQSEFQQVITESINCLSALLNKNLHSIYIYGSVAKGQATPYKSDLDLCVIVNQPVNQIEVSHLAQLQETLASDYQVVSKIDFDLGSYPEVMDKANLYSWGYWIKHRCRCLYGDDLSKKFMPFLPSKKIVDAVNGDFIEVLNGYIHQIDTCRDLTKRKFLQRAASRKLIRSTDLLRKEADKDWPDSLEDYVQKIIRRYPTQKRAIQYFLVQAREPSAHDEQFTVHLYEFMNWLSYERDHLTKF
ncbi:nucleotidyltransferase domain-containing protein [Providencia vermicola]|uniref:nucleotidyltransferase domain-containing protein n=1 Tax=Providencia vermicola TaxID=333965 RepID=UPI0021FD76AF|nr:nucleotidyltransferase domain-containing protein [Providencia stuartii]